MLPLLERADLRGYHLLPAVVGDLLCRNGSHEEARDHFLRSAALTKNSRGRTTMQDRAALCAAGHPGVSDGRAA